MSRLALLRLALDLLRGRWRDNLNIAEEHARSVQITFSRRRFGRRKRSIWASIDGELSLLDCRSPSPANRACSACWFPA
jgi:diacylglycerol kinase family enzyme